MLLKLHQLVNAKPILDKLLTLEISFPTSFRISQILNFVYENFKTFDDLRVTLVKKLGVLNEETGNYDIPEENRDEFVKELNEVLELEIAVDFFKLNINDIPKSVTLTPVECNIISVFFNTESNDSTVT
jgi:hypothetical protein